METKDEITTNETSRQMFGINWIVRFKNKAFWLALIPAVLLLVQACAAPFGYQWDFGVLNAQLAAIVNAVFAVLTILGVVTDHTTAGFGDSCNDLNQVCQFLHGFAFLILRKFFLQLLIQHMEVCLLRQCGS